MKKYNSELQDYANRVAGPFHNYLERGRSTYADFLRSLHTFYFFMSYLVENGLIPNDDKHVSIRVLYSRAALALFGVYTSLANGLITEAAPSLRALFEAYLNIKLIFERDTVERLRLFENFEKVDKWNSLDANRQLLKQGTMTQEQFARTYRDMEISSIENDYESVKADYNPKRPHHWAWKIFQAVLGKDRNPSLKSIADYLGLGFDYVKVYSSTSIAVHGSATLANVLSTGKAISLAPQFPNAIINDACIALDYAGNIVELCVKYFDFRNPNEITIFVEGYVLSVMDLAEGRT